MVVIQRNDIIHTYIKRSEVPKLTAV